MLRLKKFLNERRERLVHQYDPRAGAILPPVGRKRLDRLMNLDAVEQELLHQRRRGWKIVLVTRDHVGERRLLTKALDVVASRLITVVEQRFAVLCGRVQHRHRSAEHVAHCIAEPPPSALPRAAVENFGPQRLPLFWKLIDRIEVWRGISIERGLGEESDAVSKDMSEIQKARIPVVEPRSMHGARHPVLIQVRRHVYSVSIQPSSHQRMNV